LLREDGDNPNSRSPSRTRFHAFCTIATCGYGRCISSPLPVTSITYEDAVSVRETLRKLPARRNTRPMYRDKSKDELLALNIPTAGAIAEFENDLRKERQLEGIEKAKASGVKFGPKKRLPDEDVISLKTAIASGEKSMRDVAQDFGISRASLYRYK